MMKNRRNLRCNELIENKEASRLIWLDKNIDNSDDSIKTQTMLLELNPATQFYTDSIQCINDIELITDGQILFIISGSFARNVLSQIHYFRSIAGIFIFCTIRENHVSLMNDYKKIIEIYTDQKDLLKSICQTLNLLEKQAMTFSLFDQKQKSSQNLSKESASFLWHHMILQVLEQMPQTEQSKKDLLNKCQEYYEFNKDELNKINEFRNDYYREKAIEWYTKECFLYKLLNKALRTENIELIYSFRFFIIDLCSDIKQEYFKSENNEVFTTYRGQTISIEEFDKWKNNIGTIISINGFFSTSPYINESLKFVRQGVISDDIQPILFEIEVDPSVKTVIYADISHRSQHQNEQEILFNLNSLFKIISVDFDLTYKIWKIKLKTTDEGMEDIEQHHKYIQQEIDECSPIIYFGWLLLHELGQIDQAEKYFQMLLKTLPSDHPDIAAVYNGIGRVNSEKNNLNLSLKNYEIALKIRQERLPPNHSRIAASFHNIANIVKEKGMFDQALEYYQKALMIEEDNHSGDHLQKAVIIQNIGNTYIEIGNLDAAFDHLSRALHMFQSSLLGKRSKISTCLGDIGFIYEKKGDFNTALDYYHRALEIDEDCLPPDHPHLCKDLESIVFAYKNNKQLNKGLELCRKKLDALKNNSPNNHTRIAQILITMAKVSEENNLYVARQYYEEALSHLKKSTPINQQAIAKCLHYLGRLYAIYKKVDKALPILLKAMALYHQLLPSDHIVIANICRLIGLCYQKINKPSEALIYFNESLLIHRDNYRSDHENVKLIEADIAKLNGEQQTTTNLSEPIEEKVNDEQQTTTNSAEVVQENVNDEQLITVEIDSDARLSIVEPSPPPVNDSALPLQSDRGKIKKETKTSAKRKKCRLCVIL